jgi:histidinol-phosphate/aromatic aminotransferase/cobyric acid decarboxylase-like protein
MGTAAIQDQAYLRHIVLQTIALRDRFAGKLKSAGMVIPQSHTNFVLLPFADAEQATLADAALRHAGFVLRRLQGYELGHCLRATVASSVVMDTVADILIQHSACLR